MENHKKPVLGKKKIILFSAILLLLIGGIIILASLLHSSVDVTDSTETTRATEAVDPSSEIELPAQMPLRLWDMEALPDDLLTGGIAYANSNEYIYGNVELHGVDGKGINGSRAFGHYQIGPYSGGDQFMMTGNSMGIAAKNWSNAEMLWFWVNGTDLTSQIRLDIMINGLYLPVGETYYTINKQGECEVAGTLLIGWGNTQTRSRLRISPGYEGWIGLPLELFGSPSNFSSMQIHVGNSTISTDQQLYLDEFWLTKMYEVPDLPLDTLNYSCIKPISVPACVWDAENMPEDFAKAGISTNAVDKKLETNKLATHIGMGKGKGFKGTNALGWYQDEAFDNQNNYTIFTKKLEGFKNGWQNGKMLWVWVNGADVTGNWMLDLKLNDNPMAIGESYYTINSSGKCVKAGIIPKGYATTTTIGRIPIKAGFQGWIGVPLDMYGEHNSISSIKLHVYKKINKGDTVYFDELWITEMDKVPEYTSNELNYRTLNYVSGSKEIWSMKDVPSNPTSASWAWLEKGPSYVTSLIRGGAGTGYGDLCSLGYRANMTNPETTALGSGHQYYIMRFLKKNDVQVYNYTWSNPDNKILWFYMNAETVTSSNLFMDLKINDVYLKPGSHYYGIEKNINGNLKPVDMGVIITRDDMEYARIKVDAGFKGWVGVPLSAWDSPITIREIKWRALRALLKDEAVYISDFWITTKDSCPGIDPDTIEDTLLGKSVNAADFFPASDSGLLKKDLSGSGIVPVSKVSGQNEVLARAMAHRGFNDAPALGYTFMDASNTTSRPIILRASALKDYGFKAFKLSADDDMIWMYVDAIDMTSDQRLDIKLGGVTLGYGAPIYTIADNGSGNGTIRKINFVSKAATVTEGIAPVPNAGTNSYTRIKICNGFTGWVGFSAKDLTQGGTLKKGSSVNTIQIEFYKNGSEDAGSVQAGDTIYISAMRTAKYNALPALAVESASDLLYTRRIAYTADEYLSDSTLFIPKWYTGADPASLWTKANADFADSKNRITAASGFSSNLVSIGHRGDRWETYYPENSLEGIMSVVLYGADMVEIDVRNTKDGVPVLMHDETLTRTTNVTAYRLSHPEAGLPASDKVSDWTYDQIRMLNLRFSSDVEKHNVNGAAVTEYKVPSLESILKAVNGRAFVTLDGMQNTNWTDILNAQANVPGSENSVDVFYFWNWIDNVKAGSVFNAYMTNIGFHLDRVMDGADAASISDHINTLDGINVRDILRPDGSISQTTLDVVNSFAGKTHIYGELLGAGTTGLENNIGAQIIWKEMVESGRTVLMTENIYRLIDFVRMWNDGTDPTDTERHQTAVWNLENSNLKAGASAAAIAFDAGRNTATASVDTAHGVGKTGKALRYCLTSVAKSQSNNLKINAATLKDYGFNANAVIKAPSDILWFWMYSDTSAEQLLHIELNEKFLAEGSSIYYLEDDGTGKAVRRTSEWHEAASAPVTVPTATPSAWSTNNTYARIKLPIGWSGFIGIPASAFSVNSSGTAVAYPSGSVSGITMRLYGNEKSASAGDSLYLDEFWITSANLLPDLSDSALIYRYVPETNGIALDFERDWVGSAHLDEGQTKPDRTRFWGYTVWSSSQKIETISFADAKAEGLTSKAKGGVLRWQIDQTWVGSGDGNTGGLKKCAGGFAYLNLNKQQNQYKNMSHAQVLTAYIDASKANNSAEIELRLIEEDANGIGQLWETYGPTGALSNITYYIEDENGSWKSGSSFQGRIVIPAGYTGRIAVEFDDMIPIAEKDASSTLLYGSDTVMQRENVNYLGISIRGTEGDVIYVDNMGTLDQKISSRLTSDFRLSSLFGDGMIFQQKQPFTIKGFGASGNVTVTLKKGTSAVQTKAAAANADGSWSVTMDAVDGSYDRYSISASCGGRTTAVKNVVFGEVWITGGQSNMQLRVQETEGWGDLFSSGKWQNENIRIYRQQPIGAMALEELGKDTTFIEPHGTWGTGSDWTDVYASSSVGYYFAVQMQAKLGVPFGIVNSAVGGTGITVWIDPEVVTEAEYPELSSTVKANSYDKQSSGALNYVGNYFTTRIAPFKGYNAAGMIWYQGEHDKTKPDFQTYGMEALVESWTNIFRSSGDPIPVVSMQVAPYAAADTDASLSGHYIVNAAMRDGLARANAKYGKLIAAPVATYDFNVIVDNIHPTNKREVAMRAANTAYALVYDKSSDFGGAVIRNAVYDAGSRKITLTFDNAGTGLIRGSIGTRGFDDTANKGILPASDPEKLNGFTIWDGLCFYNVSAEIASDDTVILALPAQCADVSGLYYGYGTQILTANLFNTIDGYNYPVLPFSYSFGEVSVPEHQISIWDGGDGISASDKQTAGSVSANTARTHISSFITTGRGMIAAGTTNQSDAWTYAHESVITTGNDVQAETTTLGFGANILGINQNVTPAPGDIFWIWMSADFTGPQSLFIYLNSQPMETDKVYTIADNGSGVPVIKEIGLGKSANGISLANHGSSGWQRFDITANASGWIGIPVDSVSGTAGNLLSSVQVFTRSYSPAQQENGDAIFFDEFWITSSGKMPALSDDQLLFNTFTKVPTGQKLLWDMQSEITGQQPKGAVIGNTDTRGSQSAKIIDAGGINADGFGKSIKYEIVSPATGGVYQTQTMSLSGGKIGSGTEMSKDDIIWLRITANLSIKSGLLIQPNGQNFETNYIYTIVNDGSGKAVAKKINRVAAGSPAVLEANGIGLEVHSGAVDRIVLDKNAEGWIGIPVQKAGYIGSGLTKISAFLRTCVGSSSAPAAEGSCVCFDEIWICDNNKLPNLSDAQLLRTGAETSDDSGDPTPPVTELRQIRLFDAESETAGSSAATMSGISSYNSAIAAIGASDGVLDSKGIRLYIDKLASTASNRTNIAQLKGSVPASFDFNQTIAAGDILWFWVSSNASSAKKIVLRFNDTSHLIGGTKLYSIKNNGSGSAVICDGSENGFTLETHSKLTKRIVMKAGTTSGWVGIPMDSITTSDAAASLAGKKLTGFDFWLMDGAKNFKISDYVCIDEIWLTGADTMPNLSNGALLDK